MNIGANNVIKGIMAFNFIFFILIGCGSQRHAFDKPIIKYVSSPLLVNNFVHDTVKTIEPKKPMTRDQLKELLKYNYDTFFASDFKAITATNTNLVSIIQDMRVRGITRQRKMDSVVYANAQLQKTLSDIKIAYARIETKIDKNEEKDEEFRKGAMSNESWNKAMDKFAIYGIIITIALLLTQFAISKFTVNKAIKRAHKSL